MRSIVLVLTVCLGLVSILSIGCAESTMLPPASAAPATHGRIRAVVRIGGAARKGVEVSLASTATPPAVPGKASVTSESGEVVFDDLPFGDYTVTVRSPSTGRSMGNPVTVSQKAASTSVDFDLGK